MDSDVKRQDDANLDDTPLKTVTLSSLLKLHHVERKPPTEEQAKEVRGIKTNTFGSDASRYSK